MSDPVEVAIIGAGAAGIAAALAVRRAGRSTILIEAEDRVGGRARTETVDGLPLDLGCGWLHSADRNPLTALAEQAGFTVDRAPSAWGVQYRDLGFSPAEQRAAGAAWEAFQRDLSDRPPPSDRAADALPLGGPWNAHAEALSGYINGASLSRLSIADYLAYEDAASDVNWRVREGYGAFIASRAVGVPLSLANPVTKIDMTGRSVRIETRSGPILARRAIVTVSTNVLAAGAIRFAPALDDHLHAAAQLPLGLADKLFFALAEGDDLPADSHLIGNPHRAETGSYSLRPFGRPVIEAFFGGAGAVMIERDGPAAAFAFAADELCTLLGSGFRTKLRPLAGSSWCRMDRVRGSYSHALPGHAAARATLARPVGERLFFAGEATHRTDFSTAHGAWESGLRAAGEALAGLS